MGYLDTRDYRKIKNIIETFIDSPIIIDNLLKSLILFLETKNEKTETVTIVKEEKLTPVSSSMALRVRKEIENADIALDKFTERLRSKNDKRKRKASSEVSS